MRLILFDIAKESFIDSQFGHRIAEQAGRRLIIAVRNGCLFKMVLKLGLCERINNLHAMSIAQCVKRPAYYSGPFFMLKIKLSWSIDLLVPDEAVHKLLDFSCQEIEMQQAMHFVVRAPS